MGLCLVPLVAADDNGVYYYDFKWFGTIILGVIKLQWVLYQRIKMSIEILPFKNESS